ncbi:MAG: DMT family transporter [Candidatus Dojkabacteria bacterium]
MSWQLLTFISIVSLSFSRLLQKILLSEDKSDPIAYSIIFQFIVGIIVFIFALLRGFNLSGYEPYIGNFIIMGFLYAAFGYCLFFAFKLSDASSVALYFSTNVIWTSIASVVILGENLTVNELVGIVIIFAALIILNFNKKLQKPSKGEIYALLAAIFLGIAFANDAYIIGSNRDVPSYLTISFLLPTLITALVFPKNALNIKSFLNRNVLPKIILLGALYSIAAVAIFSAYQYGGDASIISPLNQTSIILTVIMAIFILKEKQNLNKKIIASILAVIGAIIIGI